MANLVWSDGQLSFGAVPHLSSDLTSTTQALAMKNNVQQMSVIFTIISPCHS